MNKDWTDPVEFPKAQPTEREQELLSRATPFQVRMYGNLDQATLEAMIIGNMVVDPDNKEQDNKKIETIIDSGIKADWFEVKELAGIFTDLCAFYKKWHKTPTFDDMGVVCQNNSHSNDEAVNYKHVLQTCFGAVLSRKIGVELLIERWSGHYLQKFGDKLYLEFQKERADPKIGPKEATKRFRERVSRNLVDTKGAEIKCYDLIEDCEATLEGLRDMKRNPEKYQGLMCGIKAIDKKTKGFRKGHLTVIVGAHGGFKTTLMLNIAFGIYLNSHNVLYISLEMAKDEVHCKLWCRATGTVAYSRLYTGGITDPEDWAEVEALIKKLEDVSLTHKEKVAFQTKLNALQFSLKGQEKGKEDSVLIAEAKFTLEKGKNKFRTLVAGQSEKLKVTQIEKWLQEQATVFKPDIIFLDYLGLMDPENQERQDIGFSDICIYMRQLGKNMGFSTVTAAQLKRSAIERLKKHGVDKPEKAELDTADISDSHRIGGDAENVFILWREPGGTSLRIFTAKARHGERDTSKGETVQVDHETCTISDAIRDTGTRAVMMGIGDGNQAQEKFIKAQGTGLPKTDLGESDNDDIFANPLIERPLDGDGDDGPTRITVPSEGIDL